MRRIYRVLIFINLLMFVGFSTVQNGFATSNDSYSEQTQTGDVLVPDNFELMSREEYIAEYAEANNISYLEAEQAIDSDIEATLASIPSTLVWDYDTMVNNGDTTFTYYGRVYNDYEDLSGMKVRYSVQAVLIASHYGSTWASCGATGTILPRSGNYNFYGTCTASLISNRQLRMVAEGYFEIAEDIAVSSGINVEVLELSLTIGSTRYYRSDVYDVHIETTSIQGG